VDSSGRAKGEKRRHKAYLNMSRRWSGESAKARSTPQCLFNLMQNGERETPPALSWRGRKVQKNWDFCLDRKETKTPFLRDEPLNPAEKRSRETRCLERERKEEVHRSARRESLPLSDLSPSSSFRAEKKGKKWGVDLPGR